jgi:SNF2 family DNA or RNA helicase
MLETILEQAGFKVVRLDGRMSRLQRIDAIKSFNKNPEITIFLISLKGKQTFLEYSMVEKLVVLV